MLDSLDALIAFVLIMLVVSLLITIAVQMISSFLNLRGLNLVKGIGKTFTVILPDAVAVEKNAKDLAWFVLKGRLISDSSFIKYWPPWWRLAAAVRPDEVFDSIHRIATGRRTAPDTLRQNARQLLIALGLDEDKINAAAAEVGGVQQTVKQLTDAANDALNSIRDQSARDKVEKALKDVNSRLSASEAALAAQIVAASGSIDDAYKKFQYWTEICQERVQQWFTTHTRIFTVVFAFVFAFWLQLDAVAIFQLVSSNKTVRDKLVAQAGAVEAQAAKVLGDNSTLLKDALKNWSEKETDPAIKSAISGVDVKATDTREEIRDKVAKALAGKTPTNTFDSIVNDTVTQRVEKQAGNFSAVKADLDKSGFDLFPSNQANNEPTRWGDSWSAGCRQHLSGILFSVGLLSLGAPFWYNTLKNLTSLRSAVAQNISKEQEQAQKQGDAAKSKPPPTVK